MGPGPKSTVVPSALHIGRRRSRPCVGHTVSVAYRRCSREQLRRLATDHDERAAHDGDESVRQSAAQTSTLSTWTLQ